MSTRHIVDRIVADLIVEEEMHDVPLEKPIIRAPDARPPLILRPLFFVKSGVYGDPIALHWSIPDKRRLILINDSIEKHNTDDITYGAGFLRRFNVIGCPEDPQTFGLRTGSEQGGFKILTDKVRDIIDSDFAELIDLVEKHGVEVLCYPAKDGKQYGLPLWADRKISPIGDEVMEYFMMLLSHLGRLE